jgi:methyl coenzyme M reductase subunit C
MALKAAAVAQARSAGTERNHKTKPVFEPKYEHGSCRVRTKVQKNVLVININGKGIPLHAWTGPEDSKSLRLPEFKTIST